MAGDDEARGQEEKQKRELMLDKTLADTFPASDPPSTDPNPYPEDTDQAA